MKKLKLIIIVLLALYGCQQEPVYCGRISQKYTSLKNNGGTQNVVFYCDSLHTFVNVEVSPFFYANIKEGEEVCFKLSNYQIEIIK